MVPGTAVDRGNDCTVYSEQFALPVSEFLPFPCQELRQVKMTSLFAL